MTENTIQPTELTPESVTSRQTVDTSIPTISPTPSFSPPIDTPPKSSNAGPVIFIVSLLVLILGASFVALTYLIASEKINIGNPTLQASAEKLIYQIPFVPKTPKYILTSSLEAHTKLSKNSYDISVASTSDSYQQMLGSNQFDFQVKGYTDFADTKNPKFSMTLDITKQLSLEARKNDKMIYAKINKIPLALTAMLSIDPTKLNQILDNWVYYDSSPMDTEARKNVPEITGTTPNSASTEVLKKLLTDEVLPMIKVSSENVDSTATYKLSYKPTPDELDKIYKTLSTEISKQNPSASKVGDTLSISQYIKNFSSTVWINENNHFINKVLITFNVINDQKTGSVSTLPVPVPAVTEAAVAIAIKLSDYGKDVQIEIPAKSITPEEYYGLILNSTEKLSGYGSGVQPLITAP